MAAGDTGNYICYARACGFSAKDATDILKHSFTCKWINQQDNFSLRQKIFDENFGIFVFKSVHFNVALSTLMQNGSKCHIDVANKKISVKRALQKDDECIDTLDNEPKCGCKSSLTEEPDIYRIMPEVIRILKEKDIFDEFFEVLKCTCSGQMIGNIAFHLMLDVARFFSKPKASDMRYNDISMSFWLTVQKLFKGKGIHFFRGYKGEGSRNSSIETKKCLINFAVPSDPVLSHAASQYRDDATKPGILNLTLDAYAKANHLKNDHE